MDLGPQKIEFGPVDMVFETPVPGTPVANYVICLFEECRNFKEIWRKKF